MPAPIQELDPRSPQPRVIERAAERLRADEMIGFAGDTGYMVACRLSSKRAAQGLFGLKKRSRNLPPTLICSSLAQVAQYGRVSQSAFRNLRELAPGPFTFILLATRGVPKGLLPPSEKVGLRIPDSAMAQALVEAVGEPLLMRSATAEDGTRLLDARDLKERWGSRLSLILDGGLAPEGPSTVLSLVDDELTVVRPGVGELELAPSA